MPCHIVNTREELSEGNCMYTLEFEQLTRVRPSRSHAVWRITFYNTKWPNHLSII